MTLNELIDRIKEIDSSLDPGNEEPKVLNEYALKGIRRNISNLISDLENDVEELNAEERGIY